MKPSEQYKANKLAMADLWILRYAESIRAGETELGTPEEIRGKIKSFLSQTIDELYAELQSKDVTALYAGLRVLESDYLPKDVCMIGTGKKCGYAAFSQKIEVTSEAEKMRDNQLRHNRHN